MNILHIELDGNASDHGTVEVRLRTASYGEVEAALETALDPNEDVLSRERWGAIRPLIEEVIIDGDPCSLRDTEYLVAHTILAEVLAFLAAPKPLVKKSSARRSKPRSTKRRPAVPA